ncbi:alpha/beta fold hydrolase [Nonomuraea sp. NPDC046570]|uniref:thioesterase II family protein n=1 Tax=Nonomuraea sp. NPDC046570 TaxID=3155255 RepID=UPI003405F447
MTHDVASPMRWFAPARPRPDARLLLFCLPYAGAGAGAFRGWAAAADPRIEVLPVVLPGREGRYNEAVPVDVGELTDAIAARADRPYAIYGHSMGGRLGFEVVRELRRRGGRLPRRLVLGGCRPPDTLEPLGELAKVTDEDLLARLTELGGLPAEVLAEPELVELVLPTLRADFAWLDAYVYAPEPPIEVPITAFAAEDDPAVPYDLMRGWSRHTAAGFGMRTETGGHFFLHQARDRILETICEDMP